MTPAYRLGTQRAAGKSRRSQGAALGSGWAQAPLQLRGLAAEDVALAYLTQEGLRLEARNWRVRGGELDLVMREPDGTLVFVEVRTRRRSDFGGAAGSITPRKRQRIALAAQLYLQRMTHTPACRFDVVTFDGEPGAAPQWLKAAFDLG